MSPGGMLPDFIRERYSRKFAIIGLVIILVVSGIGFVTQSQVNDRLIDEKKTTVQTNAQLEAQTFAEWLGGQKKQIRTLSNHRELQSGDTSEIRNGLQTELDSMSSEVASLHYVHSSTGQVVASTNQDLEGSNINETEVFWNPAVGFQFDDGNEKYVLESFVYKGKGGKSAFVLGSLVPDTNHAVLMTIRTDRRAQRFSSSIDGTRTVVIGGFTQLVLFSEDNEIILKSYRGNNSEGSVNTEVERIVNDSSMANEGAVIENGNVVGFASVEGTDWVVVKEAPKSEALALQADVQSNLIILIGAAIVGLIVLNVVTALGPMRSLRRLKAEAEAIAAGDLSVEIEESNRIDEVGGVRSSFRAIKSYIDTAAGQTDALATQDFDDPILEEEVPGPLGESLQGTRNDLEESIEEMESARKQAEVAQAEAEQLADYLKEQAEEYSEVMQQVSAGDLTQRMESDGQEESMERIAEEFNEMIAELEKTTGQLQSYVDEVEQAGEDVELSADTVRTASEQVAESIQKISDDAYTQKENLQNISEMMDDLTADLEDIVAQSGDADVSEQLERIEQHLDDLQEIATKINEVVELSDATMAESEQVAGAAQEQAAELNEVSERANDLQRYAQPLRDILDRFKTEEEHEFVFSVGPTGDEEGEDSDDR